MNLKLRSIIAPGELSKERLTLKAQTDLDLGDYIVAQSGYADDSPTTTFFQTVWFPYKRIKKGDLVVIYSKKGTERERSLSTGKVAHFYYMDLTETIWDDPNTCALVLYAPEWVFDSATNLNPDSV